MPSFALAPLPDLTNLTEYGRGVMAATLIRAADRFQWFAYQQRDSVRADGFDEERAAGIYEDVSIALRSWAENVRNGTADGA